MKQLDVHTQEVSKLVSVINDVSDQTKLLALNAAIEAARAGEHGKGFIVVANEVKLLAEQVALSVKDITEIVGSIQSESGEVSNSLQDGYAEVERGSDQVRMTNQTFHEIRTAVSEMAQNTQVVSDHLTDMSKRSQGMSHSVEEIASISEEAAAGVEETTASAQSSRTSMEEVAKSSELLADMSEELNGLVGRFKL